MHLIVFDVDGTLVDSQRIIVAAQHMAFEALGLTPPSRERSLSIVGLSLVEAFRVLTGDDGPAESLAEAYKRSFNALRADPAMTEPLFPGVEETLEWLAGRDDVLMGIATGKSRRGVDHLLARHGWEQLFATIQTADDAPSKPHPAMLHQAMAETGIGRARTVMIGDTSYDMAMAKAAGCRALGVAWGYHARDELERHGAGEIIHKFIDIKKSII